MHRVIRDQSLANGSTCWNSDNCIRAVCFNYLRPIFTRFFGDGGASIGCLILIICDSWYGIDVMLMVVSLSDDIINAVPQSLRMVHAGLGATNQKPYD